MKIEINKVQNGFIISVEYTRDAGPTLGAFVSSYRAPTEKVMYQNVFEEWADAQAFIRKQLGVCE